MNRGFLGPHEALPQSRAVHGGGAGLGGGASSRSFSVVTEIVVGGAWLGLAVCLFALGIAIYLRAVWDFAMIGKGTPAPIDAPKRLVVRGIYRYSRNPLYVAMLLVVAGWAALFGTAVPLAYAAGLFVMYSLVIRFHEEPHLAREFGDEYAAYTQQVGRWLPRLRRR